MIPPNLPPYLRKIMEQAQQAIQKASTPCKGCQERREALMRRVNQFRARNRVIRNVRRSGEL
jgi:hypothetical protein